MNDMKSLSVMDQLASTHVFPLSVGDASTFGLTKRELFAAMAMQGIRSDPNGPGLSERIAEEAVQIADALLKELAK